MSTMPRAYSRVPLEEPEEEEEENDEALVARSCLDALRGALPPGGASPQYAPLSTAADDSAPHTASTLSARPSCLEFVLRSVPSFRSHARYASVPLDEVASDDDVVYEVDSAPDAASEDALHQNGSLQLQYDDRLHLLSTEHGVHGVQVPHQTRDVLRRIPAAATRLVRKTRAKSGISKSVGVLREKVRGVRWAETAHLFCRWLLHYKRLLPIVSLATIIVLLSINLTRSGRLYADMQNEYQLLMAIQENLQSIHANQVSLAHPMERVLAILEDFESQKKKTGTQSANIGNENILAKNNSVINALATNANELVKMTSLLQKISSDIQKFSTMSTTIMRIDRNLDTVKSRGLLEHRRFLPTYGRSMNRVAFSGADGLLSDSILSFYVYITLVGLALKVRDFF